MNCIPWDFPLPSGSSTPDFLLPLCMSFEGEGYTNTLAAFDRAMRDVNNSKDCHEMCQPNCDETTYEYTIDTTELNTEELCSDGDTREVVVCTN